MDNINISGPRVSFEIPIFGGIKISESLVVGWILIVVIFLVCRWLTKDMKKVPEKKRQVAAEYIVTFFNNMVKDNMGTDFIKYTPYIATIFVFALTGSLFSLLGFRSMTADINVTGTWAAMTFILITYNRIKYKGIGGYFKGFTEPVVLMTPLNVLSEVATPVAMALRMFGNISGGMIITTLLYAALGLASSALYGLFAAGTHIYYFNVFQIGIPAVLSIYFDLFSSVIQSYVFIMLTMAYIRSAKE